MDQDPYQPDHSGVTDHVSDHHQWWKPIAWVVGGTILGETAFRRTPLGRILAFLIGVAIAVVVVYLIHAHLTDPRNTPLPVPTTNQP